MRAIFIMVMTLSICIGSACLAQDDTSDTSGSKETKEIKKPTIIQKGNTCQVPGGATCQVSGLLPIGSSCCCPTPQGQNCNGRIVR